MTILLLVFLFFVVFAFVNYEKSLFVWATFCIIAHNGLCLKYSSPAVSLQLAINLFFFVFYIVKKGKSNTNKDTFILANFWPGGRGGIAGSFKTIRFRKKTNAPYRILLR